MSSVTAGIVGIVVMVVLLGLGMPLGPMLMLVGFLGAAYIVGLKGALGMLGMMPYDHAWSYSLSCMPLFVLMGSIVFHSGTASRLFDSAHKFLGHLPGGLGMATIAACGGFSAVCGSSVATAATMGTVALPEMERHNYKKSFATGMVAAGGTLGILIPPSITFVLYGVMTEQSIGRLFMAGIFPGILVVAIYMGVIAVVVKLRPDYAQTAKRVRLSEAFKSLTSTWSVWLLFLIVIGGLYWGLFTPTEAGAIGAFGALVISIISGWFTRKGFLAAISETVRTTGMVFAILIGAFVFNYFLTVSELTFVMAKWVVASNFSHLGVLLAVLVIYMILGCFLDSLAMILLTIPIFTPVLFAAGFDPILVGVLIVRMVELAMITPPFGMNVFVIKGIARDVPMDQIFSGVMPFVAADVLITLPLLIIFPQISLFLPNLMYQ